MGIFYLVQMSNVSGPAVVQIALSPLPWNVRYFSAAVVFPEELSLVKLKVEIVTFSEIHSNNFDQMLCYIRDRSRQQVPVGFYYGCFGCN